MWKGEETSFSFDLEALAVGLIVTLIQSPIISQLPKENFLFTVLRQAFALSKSAACLK